MVELLEALKGGSTANDGCRCCGEIEIGWLMGVAPSCKAQKNTFLSLIAYENFPSLSSIPLDFQEREILVIFCILQAVKSTNFAFQGSILRSLLKIPSWLQSSVGLQEDPGIPQSMNLLEALMVLTVIRRLS